MLVLMLSTSVLLILIGVMALTMGTPVNGLIPTACVVFFEASRDKTKSLHKRYRVWKNRPREFRKHKPGIYR